MNKRVLERVVGDEDDAAVDIRVRDDGSAWRMCHTSAECHKQTSTPAGVQPPLPWWSWSGWTLQCVY